MICGKMSFVFSTKNYWLMPKTEALNKSRLMLCQPRLAESVPDHSLIAPLSNMPQCQWWGVTLIKKFNPAVGRKHHSHYRSEAAALIRTHCDQLSWRKTIVPDVLRQSSHPRVWVAIEDELRTAGTKPLPISCGRFTWTHQKACALLYFSDIFFSVLVSIWSTKDPNRVPNIIIFVQHGGFLIYI